MSEIQNQGSRANQSGKDLETRVQQAILSKYEVRLMDAGTFKKSPASLLGHGAFLIPQAYYPKILTGAETADGRVDFLLWCDDFGVSIECKNQTVPGSVEEKQANICQNVGMYEFQHLACAPANHHIAKQMKMADGRALNYDALSALDKAAPSSRMGYLTDDVILVCDGKGLNDSLFDYYWPLQKAMLKVVHRNLEVVKSFYEFELLLGNFKHRFPGLNLQERSPQHTFKKPDLSSLSKPSQLKLF